MTWRTSLDVLSNAMIWPLTGRTASPGGAPSIAPLHAPAATTTDSRFDEPVTTRPHPGHAVAGSDQCVDGLAAEVADAPSLARADERAHELDVVDPGASGDVERGERRRADGRLETPQVVRADERDARLARGGIACRTLGLANLFPGHAEPEVPGAPEADVDAALLAERVRQRLVEVAAQPAEDGHGLAPRRIGKRQDSRRMRPRPPLRAPPARPP